MPLFEMPCEQVHCILKICWDNVSRSSSRRRSCGGTAVWGECGLTTCDRVGHDDLVISAALEVIIPNYVQAASNCIIGAKHYLARIAALCMCRKTRDCRTKAHLLIKHRGTAVSSLATWAGRQHVLSRQAMCSGACVTMLSDLGQNT